MGWNDTCDYTYIYDSKEREKRAEMIMNVIFCYPKNLYGERRLKNLIYIANTLRVGPAFCYKANWYGIDSTEVDQILSGMISLNYLAVTSETLQNGLTVYTHTPLIARSGSASQKHMSSILGPYLSLDPMTLNAIGMLLFLYNEKGDGEYLQAFDQISTTVSNSEYIPEAMKITQSIIKGLQDEAL